MATKDEYGVEHSSLVLAINTYAVNNGCIVGLQAARYLHVCAPSTVEASIFHVLLFLPSFQKDKLSVIYMRTSARTREKKKKKSAQPAN